MTCPLNRFSEATIVAISAFSIGVISALPVLSGVSRLGADYELFPTYPISSISFDETTTYAPPLSFLKENNKYPFETEIYELKDAPATRYLLPTFIQRLFLVVFGGNIQSVWIFSKIFFPALCFAAAYFLCKSTGAGQFPSLISSFLYSLIGFGPRVLFDINGVNAFQPIFISRINAPAAITPFLLFALAGLVKIHTSQKPKAKAIVATGILGGALFFTYYYYQIAFAFLLILLAVLYALMRQKDKLIAILKTGIVANLVAVPWYLIFISSLLHSREYELASSINGKWNAFPAGVTSEGILFIIVFLAVSFMILRKTSAQAEQNKNIFSSSLIPLIGIAGVSIFLQYASSRLPLPIIQPEHFLQQIAFGITVLLASLLFFSYNIKTSVQNTGQCENISLFRKAIALCVITILLVTSIIKQVSVSSNSIPFSAVSREETAARKLMSAFTSPDDVIAVKNPFFNSAIASKIWRFRFYGFAGTTNLPTKENVERFVFVQKLFGVPWDDVRKSLSEANNSKTPLASIDAPYLIAFRKIPESEILSYEKFYTSADASFLSGKKLDYVLVFPDENDHFLKMTNDGFADVSESETEAGVTLYKLNASKSSPLNS